MKAPWVQLVIVTSMVLSAAPAVGAAPVHSVEEFKQLKPRWSNFAETQLPLRVEGRRAFLAGTLLRFRNCDLSFRPKPGEKLPTLSGISRNVEVLGRLQKRNGELEFIVEELRERPSDLDTFQLKQGDIERGKAEQWYELGDWAAQRADFYNDEQLQQKARDAYRRGLLIERQRLAKDDIEGLMELAAKAKRMNLSDSLRLVLVHEAYRQRWETIGKQDKPDLKAFAEQLAEDLPGAKQILQAPHPELRQTYGKKPLTVYRDADQNQRRKLHRIFYGEVVLREILKGAKADGSNGFEIAAKIDRQIPERHALAETYREQELRFKLSAVPGYSRQQVLELAEQFRRRKQPEQAREALARWLNSRTERIRREGPAGLVKVADDYVDLLDDKQTAAELLMEASEQIPGSEEVASKLRRLGYRREDGQWVPESVAEGRPVDPIQQAVRQGRVVKGMTSEQVRKALGAPTSQTRIATAGDVSEVWSYGERGTSRLAVHFLRRSRDPAGEAEVVVISQIKP